MNKPLKERWIEERVWIPIDPADVATLEAQLSAADPFVTSTIDTEFPYRIGDYIQHTRYGSEEVLALLDRNLISRAAGLASGHVVEAARSDSDSYRIAAACMAFLITADVQIEPNISLYELATCIDPREATDQLNAMRIADHIHPQAYLDVAISRAATIPPEVIAAAQRAATARAPEPIADFEMPLRHWRRHRCALAQVALLQRSDSLALSKMHQLIEWSATEGFFDAVAVCFAAILYGRRGPGGLLRSIRSPSLSRCLASINNAAWDLTYVSHWIRYSQEPKRIWIFCTNDRMLARLARSSVGPDRSARDIFEENWNGADAVELHAHYLAAWSAVSADRHRQAALRDRFERIEDLTEATLQQLEAQFTRRGAS